VEVQEVGWESCGTELAGDYTFLYVKGIESYELGTAVTRVEFVIDRMSYVLRSAGVLSLF
jgi:hypothetical protein